MSAHRITTGPARKRVRVHFNGELIADTTDAIALNEAKYPVVYYVPRQDARMDRLARTAHRTHCPFKGDASYYSIQGGPENAAWSYETPYDEVEAIRGRLAFYSDKVAISVTDEMNR